MKRLVFLILPLLILVSCTSNSKDIKESYTLYYFTDSEMLEFRSVSEKTEDTLSEDTVRQIYNKLQSPEDEDLIPAIAQDIKLSGVYISGNTCTLTLSERYNKIPETSRVAINAVLTKTLCSIGEIQQVDIICGDKKAGFTESDFIIEAPQTSYETHTVNLYYANEALDGLQAESVQISLSPGTTLESAVLNRLLTPPEYEKLKSAIPFGTKLNDAYVSEGVCYIDLSSEFALNIVHDEVHEGLAIYSIVNTLTELPMINSVKFLLDGEEPSGYEHYVLTRPLTNKANFLSNFRRT